MSQTNSTAVITDRSAIADVIASTLAELDQQRSSHSEELDIVQAAKATVDRVATEYADKASEALGTGWFTVEGLAAQGHRSPKKPRKPENNTAATEIDREAIPDLITRMLFELDEAKQRLDAAGEDLQRAENASETIGRTYALTIQNALRTGWFTIEGLAGQGHHIPKQKKNRSTRAQDNEHPTAPQEND